MPCSSDVFLQQEQHSEALGGQNMLSIQLPDRSATGVAGSRCWLLQAGGCYGSKLQCNGHRCAHDIKMLQAKQVALVAAGSGGE
jgi:hypothetical protein